MSNKNIVIQLKGAAKPVTSEWIDADEAERLLTEEVVPKIGTSQAIILPGLVVKAEQVISAKTNQPSRIAIA
jgi:hypothetical protein